MFACRGFWFFCFRAWACDLATGERWRHAFATASHEALSRRCKGGVPRPTFESRRKGSKAGNGRQTRNCFRWKVKCFLPTFTRVGGFVGSSQCSLETVSDAVFDDSKETERDLARRRVSASMPASMVPSPRQPSARRMRSDWFLLVSISCSENQESLTLSYTKTKKTYVRRY